MRWQSSTPSMRCTSGEIDCSTIGPIVIGSTKCPSPTSKWNTRTPVRSRTSICSPRIEKSAAYSDGSTSTVRIQSFQGIPATLDSKSADEEPRRAVPVRHREQELAPLRVRVLRPLLSERLRLEPRRIDDRLVLVGVHRADGV